jgi:hypothetical protein
MRISKDKSITREASFKADKNIDSELDDIEEKFVRRLKRGSGKYQVMFPFKYFNCGKIGHFACKCPQKKKDQKDQNSDDPDLCRNTMKYRNTHKHRDAAEIRLYFINNK